MLIFNVGTDLYALDSSQVVEIIPRVILRQVHHGPEYVAGVFNYRGVIVPVIDLCHLIQRKPSLSHLSTRIIMVKYCHEDGNETFLGLMAERVTETLTKSNSDFIKPGIEVKEAPYLGDMIMDDKGMIQCLKLEYLLTQSQQLNLLPSKN
jgi:chemotaxis-related protein WspB